MTAIYRIPERDLLAVAGLLDDCVGCTTLDLERAFGTFVLWRHFRASDIGYTEDGEVLLILLSYLDRKLAWHCYLFLCSDSYHYTCCLGAVLIFFCSLRDDRGVNSLPIWACLFAVRSSLKRQSSAVHCMSYSAMVEKASFTQLVLRLVSSDARRPDAPPGYYWVTSDEDELKLCCRPIPLDFPFPLDWNPLPLPANGTLWILAQDHTGYHFVLRRFEDSDLEELKDLELSYNYTALPSHLRTSLHLYPGLPQPCGFQQSDSSSPNDADTSFVLRPSGVNRVLPQFTAVDEQHYKLGITLGGPRHITSEEYASVCALHRNRHPRRLFFREFRALTENLILTSQSSPLIAALAVQDFHRPGIGRANLDFVPDPEHPHVGLAIASANDRWLSYCDVRMCVSTYLGISDALAHSIWLRCRQIYVHDDVPGRGQQFIKARMNLVSSPLHVDVHFSYLEWVQNCQLTDARSSADSALTPDPCDLSDES